MVSNKEKVAAVRAVLSAARLGTYETAARVQHDDDLSALELYAWNAEVSGALLAPLHLCEVVVRNAVADVIEAVYGNAWPWSTTFEQSLPDPKQGYSPRKDLQAARRSASTAGKVIPELKFVFWQKMFTSRYDVRLWDVHLKRTFPNLDPAQPVSTLRTFIYKDLEHIRLLRNRIAHHEPIFARNLADDFQKMVELVNFRCQVAAQWMLENHNVSVVIAARP